MDSVLVDYLNSGRAWLIVGSGPSNEMGYPGWDELARKAAELTSIEGSKGAGDRAHLALLAGDFPRVFQVAVDEVGSDRTLEVLRSALVPKQPDGRIYGLLARWPVAVTSPQTSTSRYSDT